MNNEPEDQEEWGPRANAVYKCNDEPEMFYCYVPRSSYVYPASTSQLLPLTQMEKGPGPSSVNHQTISSLWCTCTTLFDLLI